MCRALAVPGKRGSLISPPSFSPRDTLVSAGKEEALLSDLTVAEGKPILALLKPQGLGSRRVFSSRGGVGAAVGWPSEWFSDVASQAVSLVRRGLSHCLSASVGSWGLGFGRDDWEESLCPRGRTLEVPEFPS